MAAHGVMVSHHGWDTVCAAGGPADRAWYPCMSLLCRKGVGTVALVLAGYCCAPLHASICSVCALVDVCLSSVCPAGGWGWCRPWHGVYQERLASLQLLHTMRSACCCTTPSFSQGCGLPPSIRGRPNLVWHHHHGTMIVVLTSCEGVQPLQHITYDSWVQHWVHALLYVIGACIIP
jgi:hypothetical protein